MSASTSASLSNTQEPFAGSSEQYADALCTTGTPFAEPLSETVTRRSSGITSEMHFISVKNTVKKVENGESKSQVYFIQSTLTQIKVGSGCVKGDG